MNRYNILSFVLFFCSGCSTIPSSLQSIDHSHQQAIQVSVDARRKTHAHVTLWAFDHSTWHKIFPTVNAMIGRSGLAPVGQKKEGDGRTPAGIYDLTTAFGNASIIKTGMNYRQATANDFWVDDVNSSQYNQWVTGKPQANSYEELKRKDRLYDLALVINYNADPIVPGAGSAIFMHIWRRYDHPTAGCVALSERHLRKILRHLDQSHHPVIILEEAYGR